MSTLPRAAAGRLVLVLVSPLAVELAALADRLAWPVTVVDPQGARLDADPVPYARTCLSVAEARLDVDCDVLVCDEDREELADLVADVLHGPPVRRLGVVGDPDRLAALLRERGLSADECAPVRCPIGPDLGARTVPELALALMAALLADRNAATGGRQLGASAAG